MENIEKTNSVSRERARGLEDLDGVTPVSHGLRRAALLVDIKICSIWKAVRERQLATVMLAGKRVVLHSELVRWVESMPAESEAKRRLAMRALALRKAVRMPTATPTAGE